VTGVAVGGTIAPSGEQLEIAHGDQRAMIGRGAAIAEVGPHRHELHGAIAFSAWLGVHAALMTGVRNRIDAFVNWGWDYFTKARGPQVLDRSDAARIDWGDADDADVPEPAPADVPSA